MLKKQLATFFLAMIIFTSCATVQPTTSSSENENPSSAESSAIENQSKESIESTTTVSDEAEESVSKIEDDIGGEDFCLIHSFLYHSYSVPLVNYVGTDTYYEWQEQNTEPCSGNIVSFVEHFNISKDKFMELYAIDTAGLDDAFFDSLSMTREEYFGAYVLSQEQIDAIYSGDEAQIENAFAGNLSVTADDGNRYSLLWLEKHSPEDYLEAGIFPESIDALISEVNTNSDYTKYRAEMQALSEQANQAAVMLESAAE